MAWFLCPSVRVQVLANIFCMFIYIHLSTYIYIQNYCSMFHTENDIIITNGFCTYGTYERIPTRYDQSAELLKVFLIFLFFIKHINVRYFIQIYKSMLLK